MANLHDGNQYAAIAAPLQPAQAPGVLMPRRVLGVQQVANGPANATTELERLNTRLDWLEARLRLTLAHVAPQPDESGYGQALGRGATVRERIDAANVTMGSIEACLLAVMSELGVIEPPIELTSR